MSRAGEAGDSQPLSLTQSLDPLALARQIRERAEAISVAQQTQLERLDSLDQLKQRLTEVRAKHGELQTELMRAAVLAERTNTIGIKGKRGKRRAEDGATQTRSEMDTKKEMEMILEANAQHRRQTLLTQAYSFAGVTVLPFKDNKLLIILGLSHEGRYFDRRYHIWLENDKAVNKLRVFKHTLPYFFPVRQLEEQYLGKNAMRFVRELNKYIHAFVSRRSQALEISEQHQVQDVETSAAFDYIAFTLQSPEHGSLLTQLFSSCLMRLRASEAVVTFLEPLQTVGDRAEREREEWKRGLEDQLVAQPPPEALKKLLARDESHVW